MLEKECEKNAARFDQLGMIYHVVKQYCQNASRDDLLQITGGIIITGVIIRCGGVTTIASNGMQAAGLMSLAYYQATVLSKLGAIGRQIQQVVGLAAKSGVGKVEQGLQVIKDHPHLVKTGQTITQAIQAGRKAVRQTNRYLKATSKAIVSKVQKIPVGESFKKIPRACIAKTKQLISDEAVVVDTWGNTWRSPISSNHWEVQLSEMGKKNLVLLNEAAATRGTIIVNELESGLGLSAEAEKIAQKLIKIEMCSSSKCTITSIGLELNQCLAKMRARGVTYRDFYGDHINPELYNRLIDLENFEHLYIPQISPKMTANGMGSKLTGMHWDKNGELEELGLIKLKNIKQHTGGMYKADMTVNGVSKPGKTLFPSHWDLETLLDKISEACCSSKNVIPGKNGEVSIIGKTSDGFSIVTKIDVDGKILTVYPSIKY